MDIKCTHCGSYNNIREVVTRCLECNNNLFNQKTENMNNVFKKGDRVYHIHHGWGEVESVERIGISVWVNFEKDKTVRRVDYYFISFTEYRLEGFTQQRPFEPEIGKFYFLWTSAMLEGEEIVYGRLTEIENNETGCVYHTERDFYYFISDKNPLHECE